MPAEDELTRSIKQIQIAPNPKPSQLLCHAWFGRALTHPPAQESVDQGGFANIGKANDGCPDRARLQASSFAPFIDAIAQ